MPGPEITKTLDVQGISCPANAMRVRAAIAELKGDELLEVLVDEGEAVLRVARTLKDCGHRIVKVENRGEGVSVIVGK
ncbi:sulfurtransferase TusA family protein [Chlorobium sp. KB01]|uniref:sulfurtransferase TusA family protein n=1 Tax=Chlorobium sp. KB01 TaxID=1917528 RepID=UPI000977C410|nr:sulfurtransferase TusA family protein [Chlorobium sp. KB01]